MQNNIVLVKEWENEAELLNVYRSLSPRDRHKLMTIAYEMQDKAKT